MSSEGRLRNRRTGRVFAGSRSSEGYLQLSNPRVGFHRVHRLVLEAFVGPAPEGHVARHLNGNPADNRLVNLAWGTLDENALDRDVHGRTVRGEAAPKALLSERQVREIWEARASTPAADVAARYPVSRHAVYDIWRGKTWGWLTGAR